MTTVGHPKILLVDNEPRTVEMLVEVFVRQLNTRMTCVSTAEDALDIDMLEPHDAVIAEVNLPLMNGIMLTEQIMQLRSRPVILMSNDPNLSQAVAALRVGVVDFFTKPFDIECLLDAGRRALKMAEGQRRQVQRHYRLRSLVRRVIRERRELNQRVDLLCRDLVGAHRRLVHRVLDQEKGQGELRIEKMEN
ncbi:MAG: response regulator [Phycisphaerae bacterium]|nr:response regulator [Phycisphaerae bacterium]